MREIIMGVAAAIKAVAEIKTGLRSTVKMYGKIWLRVFDDANSIIRPVLCGRVTAELGKAAAGPAIP